MTTQKLARCTLSESEAARQNTEWSDLRRVARRVREISGGVSVVVGIDDAERLEDLAAREAACCAFLTITVERNAEGATARITGHDPEAVALIRRVAM